MTTNLMTHSPEFTPSVDYRTPLSSAPMPSAPMLYNDDGSVAWEQMWTTFCALASAGGPPHRGELLRAPDAAKVDSAAYQWAVDEIIRGIRLVSGLRAAPATPGWIAVDCTSAAQARWLSEQINQENVESSWAGKLFFVPVAAHFTLKGEIKNVVTAVAKTTHYWDAHVRKEVKQTLAFEAALQMAADWLRQRIRS
jgi:sirohydrochlorin cobaltochelatase